MLVTEEQAKTGLWCPMIRLRNSINKQMPYNRSIMTQEYYMKDRIFKYLAPKLHWYFRGRHASCIASGCMMWRWYDRSKVLGYCGLAGNPMLAEIKTEVDHEST